MAEFIKADMSNAAAAIATRDSAIALLRRLESVKHENKALQCLCDQLSCVENILETFAAAFDKPGTCKLSLKAQHQLRAAVQSNQTACARYQEGFEERRKHPLIDSLHYSDWDGFHDLEGIESRILGERLQVLGSTMITVMEVSAVYVELLNSLGLYGRTDRETTPVFMSCPSQGLSLTVIGLLWLPKKMNYCQR